MELLTNIGAFAGLAAFLGLALLVLLYISQARDVRRLRERAAFVPEGFEPIDELGDEPETEIDTDEDLGEGDEAPAQPTSARAKKTAVAAARQAELARAAAERRARFEQRRGGSGQLGSRYGGMSDRRGLFIMLGGAAVLIVAVVFGITHLGGGGDSKESSSQGRCGGPAPQTIEVAVLNGTPTPGAAAVKGDQIVKDGFKSGKVTNSETPFTVTTVMYSGKHKDDAARVACDLQLKTIKPMTAEIRGLSEGAPVAVVVGTDSTGGATAATGATS